jgi:tetratricopeptide (TPR) repeat protein
VAFDLFMRGQTLLQEGTRQSLEDAVTSFGQAIAVDPRFALAYAALAQANLNLMNHDQQRIEELGRNARQFAAKSLAEDPRLAEAHAVYAAVCQHDWEWERSEESYDEALRLKPRFPRALRWRAGLLLQFARFKDAIEGMEQAQELDPYDRSSASGHSLTLLFANRVLDAITLLENAVAGRMMMSARHNLCQAYARHAFLLANAQSSSFYAKAIQQAELVADNEGATPQVATELFALIHAMRGDRTSASPYVRELENGVRDRKRSPVRLAWVYAIQGESERAVGLLEHALLTRDASLSYIKVNPYLESVRSLPRFRSIVSAMRLD